MPLSADARRLVESELIRRGRRLKDSARPLWPAEYASADPETACRFIFGHIKTLEETSGQATAIPDKSYLRQGAEEWYKAVETGKPLHILKSRRLIFSWFIGALELHYAGCKTAKFGICAKHYEGAAGAKSFVWRAFYMYDYLRRANPEWELPAASTFGNPDRSQLDSLVLSNGSSFEPINSDGGAVRGAGFAAVRAEELSSYDYVAEVFGQLRTVVQGPPGTVGGAVVSVSNASPNEEYLKLVGLQL